MTEKTKEEWQHLKTLPPFAFSLGTALGLVLTRALSSDQAPSVSHINLQLQVTNLLSPCAANVLLQACDRVQSESRRLAPRGNLLA